MILFYFLIIKNILYIRSIIEEYKISFSIYNNKYLSYFLLDILFVY